MNDAGGYKYSRMEFQKGNKEWESGIYCNECADGIQQDRIAVNDHCGAIFLLQLPDKIVEHTIEDISHSSLKSLIVTFQCASKICVIHKDDPKRKTYTQTKQPSVQTKEETEEEMEWLTPENAYDFFIHDWLSETTVEDPYTWFKPPKWPNRAAKKDRLKEKISEMESQMTALQARVEQKKRKLTALE